MWEYRDLRSYCCVNFANAHTSRNKYINYEKSNVTRVWKTTILFQVCLALTNIVWLQEEVVAVQNMGKAFCLNAYIDVEQYRVMSLCRCIYG